MHFYKPTLMFIEAKRLMKSKVIRLENGDKVRAKKGEYHGTFPRGRRKGMLKPSSLLAIEPAHKAGITGGSLKQPRGHE